MNFDFSIVINIASVILAIYIVVVAIYIVMENRSPQSTFAWLLLLILAPIIGLLIYIFLGRGTHAFSQEDELARQEMGSEFLRDVDDFQLLLLESKQLGRRRQMTLLSGRRGRVRKHR